MSTPPGEPNGVLDHLQEAIDIPHINGHGGVNGHAQVNGHDEANGHSPSGSQGTESPSNQQNPPGPPSPETLEELPAFDWEEFEARYEAALSQASEEERVVLKEAEALSKACSASRPMPTSHSYFSSTFKPGRLRHPRAMMQEP